nr:zinc finger, CCHC-type [Tanacetum cinerariifolium]
KEAFNDEMDYIMGNNTWVLADLPLGCKPLCYKWIFKRKLKTDVKIAFLNSEMDEEVYMNQPRGFIMPGNENKIILENGFEVICVLRSPMQDSDKPKGNNIVGPSVVSMVEHNNSSRYNDNTGKHKHHGNTKADHNKKSKDDDVAWWVDSGATIHVCKDRCWFKTYESLNDGSIFHIGNESTALVHGCGCVDLKFSSKKIVSLFNVLHVPNIKKNLAVYPIGGRFVGLEVGSIRRIQWIEYGELGFLGVGTTLDIFQNMILLYFQYDVLVFTGYGVLSLFPLWSLVSAGTDTSYLP